MRHLVPVNRRLVDINDIVSIDPAGNPAGDFNAVLGSGETLRVPRSLGRSIRKLIKSRKK